MGLNYFQIFPVDVLHDFEIGVWKAIYLHLLRILVAEPTRPNLIIELNKRLVSYRAHYLCITITPFRFQEIPTFARNTIRNSRRMFPPWHSRRSSVRRHLAMCDSSIRGLLPSPHNEIILDLLFSLAMWHGLAKLPNAYRQNINAFWRCDNDSWGRIEVLQKNNVWSIVTKRIDTKSLGGKKLNGKSKGQRLGAKPAVDISAGSRTRKGKGKGKEIQAEEPVLQAKGTKKKELNLRDGKGAQNSALSFRHSEIWDNRLNVYSNGNPFASAFFYLSHIYVLFFLLGELQHRVIKRNWVRTNKNNALTQMTI